MPSPYSHLDSIFIGNCKNSVSGWVNYEAQNGVLSQAIWNQDDDSWTSGTTFPDVRSGSDFVTELEDGPDGPWRLFASTAKESIQEYVCTDCCQNPSNNTYEPGKFFSPYCLITLLTPCRALVLCGNRQLFWIWRRQCWSSAAFVLPDTKQCNPGAQLYRRWCLRERDVHNQYEHGHTGDGGFKIRFRRRFSRRNTTTTSVLPIQFYKHRGDV